MISPHGSNIRCEAKTEPRKNQEKFPPPTGPSISRRMEPTSLFSLKPRTNRAPRRSPAANATRVHCCAHVSAVPRLVSCVTEPVAARTPDQNNQARVSIQCEAKVARPIVAHRDASTLGLPSYTADPDKESGANGQPQVNAIK